MNGNSRSHDNEKLAKRRKGRAILQRSAYSNKSPYTVANNRFARKANELQRRFFDRWRSSAFGGRSFLPLLCGELYAGPWPPVPSYFDRGWRNVFAIPLRRVWQFFGGAERQLRRRIFIWSSDELHRVEAKNVSDPNYNSLRFQHLAAYQNIFLTAGVDNA